MTATKRCVLPAPVDPEMNVKVRDTLEYSLTLPPGFDPSKKYGLVFCIPGYGDDADSDYQANKLRPYIAGKYDLIVAGVRYHNDKKTGRDVTIDLEAICSFYGLGMDYFKDSNNGDQILNDLFNLLHSKKIYSLDARVSIKTKAYHQYSSFGFMPAIDHLYVLYDVLNKYNIDKSKIIAFGSSYGGYIACLLAKYAPHTFSLVIENSGFCVSQLNEVFGGAIAGIGASYAKFINGRRYEIPTTASTLWSIEETSPYYFSDAHKKIRSLLLKEHRTPSETVYCSYHSVKDEVAPIELKDQMCEVLGNFNMVYYERVGDKDIDGILFKNLNHAMDASLRRLFDASLQKYKKAGYVKQSPIDFDMEVNYGFPCSDKIYNFYYSNQGLKVNIEDIWADRQEQ